LEFDAWLLVLNHMYLIDGYNLLYQTDFEHPSELIAKVTNLCRAKGKRAVVVFDGFSPEDLSSGYVDVLFAGDADLEIKNLLSQINAPNEYVLISSDNDLIFYARQKGVNVIKSEQFCYLLSDAIQPDNAEDKPSVGYITDKQAKDELEAFNYFKNEN
jgi:hypothetical protein